MRHYVEGAPTGPESFRTETAARAFAQEAADRFGVQTSLYDSTTHEPLRGKYGGDVGPAKAVFQPVSFSASKRAVIDAAILVVQEHGRGLGSITAIAHSPGQAALINLQLRLEEAGYLHRVVRPSEAAMAAARR